MNYKIFTFLRKLPDRVITSTLGLFSRHCDGIARDGAADLFWRALAVISAN